MTGIASGVQGTTVLPLQWPLVGRHEELDLFSSTLADPRAHGFIVYGAAGVGKTRLSDQCLALADRAGRLVSRATATEGSRSVPLGALAHLLPAGLAEQRTDLVAIMSEVQPVLLEQRTNGPMVLFVDDIHLLDATSATLVGQLVDADLVFLVATVRANEGDPVGLDALWRRARVRRVDLGDLDRESVDSLLHLVLRGPVEATTITEIWNASEGNVLFVRELVIGAIDGGHLVNQRGVWRLVGPLLTTTRLHELVADRLGALGKRAADALDVLAVWEPIGLAALEAMVGLDQLELLDRAALLTVRTDRRRQRVGLAHPLYGEILRARMPVLTRRRLLLEQVDRIAAYGSRRREDAIRVATATLEAMGSADPVTLVKAARLARYGHDYTQVELLGRAALMHGAIAEAGLLVGEALHELGKFAEADEVLAAAEGSATHDDALLVQITEIRTRNLMWGLRRDDEALEVNRRVRDRIADPAGIEELTLSEALLLTYAGRPLDALAVLAPMGTPTNRRAKALRAIAELPALLVSGHCQRAVDEAQRAFAEQMDLPEQIAIPGPEVHILMQMYGLAECGRLTEATALAGAAYDAAPSTARPAGLVWLALQRGRCALLSGRPETARRWLTEALARCEEHQIGGPTRLVLSALATAHAVVGDATAAGAAAAELDRLPPFPFTQAEQEMGRAWALVVAGDLPGGRGLLRAAAELAATTGYRYSEAWLLHDVARLGEPASVVERLAQLADVCEGDFVTAYWAHAAAAANGDPQLLVEVADRFERIGALLLAAEAANEAAHAYQRVGDRRSAAASGVRAAALAESCEGARTLSLSTPAMVVPLTPRERDIAALAAGGASSKEIAEQLFLSVRTVNNHLQNVYSKLGVSSRRELTAVLTQGT